MNRRMFVGALLLGAPMAGLWAAGCGDDAIFNSVDASTYEASAVPESGPLPQPDAGDSGVPSTCGDSTGAPARLLLSINNSMTSELVAFNIADRKVDGRLTYKGFIGQTTSAGTNPYLLEEATDVVAKMDPQKPWQILSTWNVAGDDAVDGGSTFAEPVAVAVADCANAYVLRFNRNKIAVIDTTKGADGGAPTSYIDLASLVQAGDTDGTVEMTGAVYVASKHRVYVLLANLVPKYTKDFDLLCATTTPTIVAIDTTTSKLVSLGGTGPGGGIALGGYNPPLGSSLVYDAVRDRLLVLSAGCAMDNAGVAGPIQQRRIEEVDLPTGTVKTLLSLDHQNFPGSLAFADGTHAAVTFFGATFGAPGSAYFWDPTQTTLGAQIPDGFDFPASDGKGNLVGMRTTFVDGGPGPIEVLSIPFGDAGADAASVTKLGENPFTDNTGQISNTEVWPHP